MSQGKVNDGRKSMHLGLQMYWMREFPDVEAEET